MVALSLVEDEVLSNIAASEYCLPGICLVMEGVSQTPQYRRSWDWQKSGGIPKTAVLGVIL